MDRNSAAMVLCGVLLGAILTCVLLIFLGLPWGRIATLINDNPGLATALLSPLATVGTAMVGLLGVVYAARQGFKNVIKASEDKATQDREARGAQYEREKQARDDQREHDTKVLAASLHAELASLTAQFKGAKEWTGGLAKKFAEIAADPKGNQSPGRIVVRTFEKPIYDSQVSKLGLLEPELARDVVTAYQAVTSPHPVSQDPVYTPTMLALEYASMAEKYALAEEWLPKVQAKLAEVHGLKANNAARWLQGINSIVGLSLPEINTDWLLFPLGSKRKPNKSEKK